MHPFIRRLTKMNCRLLIILAYGLMGALLPHLTTSWPGPGVVHLSNLPVQEHLLLLRRSAALVLLFVGMLRDYVLNVLIFMAVFVSMSPKLFILLRHWWTIRFTITVCLLIRVLFSVLIELHACQFNQRWYCTDCGLPFHFRFVYADMILNPLTNVFEMKFLLKMDSVYLSEIIIFFT
jgi:hypothetical protein